MKELTKSPIHDAGYLIIQALSFITQKMQIFKQTN